MRSNKSVIVELTDDEIDQVGGACPISDLTGGVVGTSVGAIYTGVTGDAAGGAVIGIGTGYGLSQSLNAASDSGSGGT